MDHGDGVAHSFDLLDLFCGKQAMSKVWSWPKKKTYDKTSTKHVNQSCFFNDVRDLFAGIRIILIMFIGQKMATKWQVTTAT